MSEWIEKMIVFANFTVILLVIHLYVPYFMLRMPNEVLLKFKNMFKIFPFEDNGKIYDRYFKIKAWKRYLPDGAKIMNAGFEKRYLQSKDLSYIQTFLIESYRAELTHILIWVHSLIFLLYKDSLAFLIIFFFMMFENLPCIMVQRYNRPRIEKIISRTERETVQKNERMNKAEIYCSSIQKP